MVTQMIAVMIIAFICYPPLPVKYMEHQDPDKNTGSSPRDSNQNIYDYISRLVVHIILLKTFIYNYYNIYKIKTPRWEFFIKHS